MYNQKVQAMGGGSDRRLFQLSGNINDPHFMEYIHFMRFFLWTGPVEELQKMRAAEIRRK